MNAAWEQRTRTRRAANRWHYRGTPYFGTAGKLLIHGPANPVFGVPLRPHNRWGGFKVLREQWQAHLESTRRRPVLLIDEAQEMAPPVLSELRLMASARFDSQPLLCVVLAGDARLPDKLRREELRSRGLMP